MHLRYVEHCKSYVATQLPRCYHNYKIKQKLNFIRSKYEFLSSHPIKLLFRTLSISFHSWKQLFSLLKIQRFIRIFLSKSLRRKKIYQKYRLEYLAERSRIQARNKFFLQWKKKIKFLQILKKNSIKKIQKWFHLKLVKKILGKLFQRKYCLLQFLLKLHFYDLKKSFGQWTRRTFAETMTRALDQLCQIFQKSILKNSFENLKFKCAQQKILQKFLQQWFPIFIQKKIFSKERTRGWHIVSPSGSYLPGPAPNQGQDRGQGRVVEGIPGQEGGLTRLIDQRIPSSSQTPLDFSSIFPNFMLPSCPSSSSASPSCSTQQKTILFNPHTSLPLAKAFQTWIVMIRYRNLLRLNLSSAISSRFTQRMIQKVSLLFSSCRLIQSMIRRYLTQQRYRILLQCRYREQERYLFIQSSVNFQRVSSSFQHLLHVMRRYSQARLRLQCWYRGTRSHKMTTGQKIILSTLQSRETAVTQKSNHRKLKCLMRILEFHCVLRSCQLAPLPHLSSLSSSLGRPFLPSPSSPLP